MAAPENSRHALSMRSNSIEVLRQFSAPRQEQKGVIELKSTSLNCAALPTPHRPLGRSVCASRGLFRKDLCPLHFKHFMRMTPMRIARAHVHPLLTELHVSMLNLSLFENWARATVWRFLAQAPAGEGLLLNIDFDSSKMIKAFEDPRLHTVRRAPMFTKCAVQRACRSASKELEKAVAERSRWPSGLHRTACRDPMRTL